MWSNLLKRVQKYKQSLYNYNDLESQHFAWQPLLFSTA